MNVLTTDNRDMVEIETELRARIDVQRAAIERLESENIRLTEENICLRSLLEESRQPHWRSDTPAVGLLTAAGR